MRSSRREYNTWILDVRIGLGDFNRSTRLVVSAVHTVYTALRSTQK